MIAFKDKLRGILRERKETIFDFCEETGISRENFFYNKNEARKGIYTHKKYVYMGMAYYLGMSLEDLLKDTEMEDAF